MEKTLTNAQPQTLAEELSTLQGQIDFLKEREEEVKESLKQILQYQGVRRVDLKDGRSYILYPKDSLKIKDKMAAQKWWLENPEARGKIDTSAAIEVAKSGKLKWAKVETHEYLRVSNKKDEDN